MRISRALALAGIDSRRKCETHVLNGAVRVNGEVVRDLGRQVDPGNDVLQFRGKVLEFGQPVYYLLNKPAGYTTTAGDSHASKTVFDLLPRRLVSASRQPGARRMRVFPVGRLDRDTWGLLLFTNDGELANRLMHPRYGVSKCYEARLDRPFEPVHKARILRGVRLSDGLAKPSHLRLLSRRAVRLVLQEGRKHEVKRIFEALGYKVVKLARTSFGPLHLGLLAPGQGRFLSKQEVAKLKKSISADA